MRKTTHNEKKRENLIDRLHELELNMDMSVEDLILDAHRRLNLKDQMIDQLICKIEYMKANLEYDEFYFKDRYKRIGKGD